MANSDIKEIMAIVAERLAEHGKALSKAELSLWYRALENTHLSPGMVEAAFNAHDLDPDAGRFKPEKPAHVIVQIHKRLDALWPGIEQAWAMVYRSTDERQTVFWPEEVAEASGGDVSDLLRDGEIIPARKAFTEIYGRSRAKAIQECRRPHYRISPGTDAALRELAAREAVTKGLIAPTSLPQYAAPKALTHRGRQIAGLISSGQRLSATEVRSRVEEIKATIRG